MNPKSNLPSMRLPDEVPKLIQKLQRRGIQTADAENHAHDAAVRALMCGEEIRSLSAWLSCVASNIGEDFRKRARPALGFTPGAHTDPIDPHLNALDQLCEDEEREALRAAIDELPDESRRVFELKMAGYTYARVAEAMGLTPAVVRGLLRRAVDHLRYELTGRP